MVYDGTNLAVYRNGNSGTNGGVASQVVTAPLGGYVGFQDGIHIGSELGQPADRNWNGSLDDLAVFNIALSQAQIQTVMSGDFSAFVPQPVLSISGSPGNVILSWSATQPTFQLQSRTNSTQGVWSNVVTQPSQNGDRLELTVPTTPATQFFRLIGP